MTTYARTIPSPIGPLRAIVTDEGEGDALRGLLWPDEDPKWLDADAAEASAAHPVLDDLEAQLAEYWAGDRRDFDVPLVAPGTEFQQMAWRALRQIPYGATWTYTQQATEMGKPTAVRAVGAANGRNPLPIVVPCHRVVGADGSLTGFAGGIDVKRYLLDHEQKFRSS